MIGYRREIDGLRALAVVPVIFFHAGIPGFTGGFVGVDIFFVISGYLITSLIIDEISSNSFSILKFYERRARRILPALYLVMLVSIPLAWNWLMPSDFVDFGESLFAVSILLSNQLFLIESGYFDAASELKPLLHTWSLAVEEQFYLIFPPIVLALAHLRRRLMWWTLLVLLVVCLIYSESLVRDRPPASFFLLFSRGWELLIGALLVYLIPHFRANLKRHVTIELGAVAGLSLIVAAIAMFDHRTQFPGFSALVPTLGTALTILFATPSTLVGQILGHKVLVTTGLISYSAYLWHQPIFAFARQVSLSELGQSSMALLVLGVFLLAYITWRFVEQPCRDRSKVDRQFIVALILGASFFFMPFGWLVHAGHIRGHVQVNNTFVKGFQEKDYRASCDDGSGHATAHVPFCQLGDPNAKKPKFALLGDSHSAMLNPLLDSMGKKHQFSYVHNGLGGCLPFLGVDVRKGNWGTGVCRNLAEKQFEYVKKHGIKTVFLLGRWSLYTQGEYGKTMRGYFLTTNESRELSLESSRSVFIKGFKDTVAAYESIGARVVVFLQVPQQKIDPKKVYARISGFHDFKQAEVTRLIDKFSISVAEHERLQEFNRSFFRQQLTLQQVTLLNPDSYFCDRSRCVFGESEFSFYTDDDHLSAFGAARLEPIVQKVIEAQF